MHGQLSIYNPVLEKIQGITFILVVCKISQGLLNRGLVFLSDLETPIYIFLTLAKIDEGEGIQNSPMFLV